MAVLKSFSPSPAPLGAEPSEHGLESILQIGRNGIELGGTRALLYSHVAIEMLRRQLFHQVGDELARAVLAQSGREAGFHDAQLLLQLRQFDSTEAMLEAQYEFLARSGFGRFELLDLAVKRPTEIYVRVRCHGAPEAESHLQLFGPTDAPACCHLVGYSTGWSSAMTGMRVLSVETHCVAKGDSHCEFETLPYDDFVGPEAAFWKQTFESTGRSLAQQLNEKLAMIEEQMQTISTQAADLARLSTPILQVQDSVLVLPVIGTVDAERVATMSETLLEEIVRRKAAGVIIDVTGVATLDASTANQLVSMIRAVRLLGSKAVVSGISPTISQLLVMEGIDLRELPTQRTLQDALQFFVRRA